MRNFKSLLSTLAGAALLATTATAEDNPQANVFKADMSNPDLAAVITSFQDVCLPFIAHKTELPQNLNQDHRVRMLAKQGFELQTREPQTSQDRIQPRLDWKPASAAFTNGVYIGKAIAPSNHFTVFDGISHKVVEPTETTGTQKIESLRVIIPAKFRKHVRDMDTYVSAKDKRQAALLLWNYPSQNHPAKSCEIKIEETSLSAETFEAAFLNKDPDWREVQGKTGTWSQCTIDGADEFRFTVAREDGRFSLSVKRNDFYQRELCRVWE